MPFPYRDFEIPSFIWDEYPEAHTYKGKKVPPDGESVIEEENVVLKNCELPIGLSYPEGQDFGPYVQKTGEGLSPSFRLDFTNGIPFSCGNVHSHTALMLFSLCMNARPQNVIETGTFYGYSTFFLAQALKLWNDEGSMVHTIDPVDNLIAEEVKTHSKVRTLKGKSEDILPRLVEELGEVHFAFLDSYKRLVYAEFEIIQDLLIPGAVVVFHDTQFLNTGRTLHDVVRERHSDQFDVMFFSGEAHLKNGHHFWGNADDRGLLVLRRKHHDPFLDVWDANSRFMPESKGAIFQRRQSEH